MLRKKISVRKIKAVLLKQYVMSLKKVFCKDRANRNTIVITLVTQTVSI